MPGKILIAEDESDIRFMLEQLLRLEGFEVLGVSDGRQALSAMENADFDLLILDLMMPGLDGFEVLKNLPPAKLAHTKVLLTTAKATEEDKIRGYSVGASHYLTKPFDNDRLVDIVKYLIGGLTAEERAELERRIGES